MFTETSAKHCYDALQSLRVPIPPCAVEGGAARRELRGDAAREGVRGGAEQGRGEEHAAAAEDAELYSGSENEHEKEAGLQGAAPDMDENAAPQHEVVDSNRQSIPQAHVVRLTRRNDNFYEDYKHRGHAEYATVGEEAPTPLGDMCFDMYASWIKVVLGDPCNLKANQYAFDEHHLKWETHVQELRASPVVPYLQGWAMPSKEKKPEEHACFMQVLLRPHCCPGAAHCQGFDAVAGFCKSSMVKRLLRDENGILAVFQDQGASASSMTAGKLLDALARIAGYTGENADAFKAYTQCLLADFEGDTQTWVETPSDRWPDTWSYDGKACSKPKYHRPVVRLLCNLYGHPLAGLWWGNHRERQILATGFTKV